MRKSYLCLASATATAFVLAAAAPALAQDNKDSGQPASDNASGTGDIIVTAQRVEQRLQDVPISMTVLNQEQLTQRNVVSTADLGSYVPSLSVNQQFGPEKASFVIRGFTQAYHTAPTVGVYFADVVAPRALGPTTSGNGAGVGSMFDLQNIQVLKGPQGTLFGRNTTGGAILLVPQKPTDRLEGYVEGTLGNYNERRLQAVLNVPLSDTFRVRGGVDLNRQDGYLKNHSGVGPKDFGNVNYVAARLSIDGDLTPDLETYTIFSYSRSNTHGDVPRDTICNRAIANLPPAERAKYQLLGVFAPFACAQVDRQKARGDGLWDVENNDPGARELIRQWSAINTTTWRASDTLTVKNIISYSEYNESASFNLWGDNFLVDPATGAPYAGTDATKGVLFTRLITLEPGYNKWTTAQNSFTEELQFQGHSLDDRLTWQAGAYLEISNPLGWNSQLVEDFTNCTNTPAVTCANPLGFGSLSDANTKDYFNDKALYAQATYKLTDKLSLTGGIRYTWDKMRDVSESRNVIPNGTPGGLGYCQNVFRFNTAPPGVQVTSSNFTDYAIFTNNRSDCNLTFKISSHKPTWLIDLDFKPSDDMLLYAKWARGYRMGSITPNSIGFETVGPEKLDLYEVGAKTSFRGGNFRGYFDIAAFYNDFHNQQIGFNPTIKDEYQGVLTNASPNVNAGHSRIWGVEIDASATLFEQLKLDVGYTYLNTKVLAVNYPTLPIYYDPARSFLTANKGDQLGLSPHNTVTVTGTYMVPLPDSVGKLSFGATFTHIDSNPAEEPLASPLYLIAAENQLNLNADWRSIMGKPIDLSFFMTNVTNQGRILYPNNSYNVIAIGGGHVNRPRMWGFRLKYHFGD